MRGRRLIGGVPAGARPTPARVREALFSMLGQELGGWTVLDAFGGSGLLVAEAMSRGAGPATVVERNRRARAAIARSLGVLGLSARLVGGDAARFLAAAAARGERWDLVLLDPPYGDDPAAWAERAAPVAARALVLEHRAGRPVPEVVGAMRLERLRTYGDTALALWRSVREAAGSDGCSGS